MEQFRHTGEVLGSLKALMVLQDDIQINRSQCHLLLNMFTLAFETIAEEIRQNLKLEEKGSKWKALEQPLREIQRVFKEGELYIRQCMDSKDWWGKAMSFHQNKDCVEFHIHNLFCHFPPVIEAIENAGEIAGLDQDEMRKKRVVLMRKYDKEWNDPKLFQWRFGKQYLVTKEICKSLDSAWKEDRWRLVEALQEKRNSVSASLTKNEIKLVDLMVDKLSGLQTNKGKVLFPSPILLESKDYQVRRRLGGGSQYKEIQWLGQSFVLRHFYGEIQPLNDEISNLLSLCHSNVVQYLCGFSDEEKKEGFLVMELMSKDLASYTKENCGPRRRVLLPIPVVVDLMLQIARGMEYLHSRKIYHGELNPFNVFVKTRNAATAEGYVHAKVSGFGLSSVKKVNSSQSSSPRNTVPPINPFIWYAPEVLAEQEQQLGNTTTTSNASKYTEKADVYSFGMICFELLTGKVPFEDGHLQGDKMSRNIRAGERPLFPYPSPKYLVSLTKKCWQTDPSERPSFSSICRVLRYIKKFHTMNPDQSLPALQSPSVDYCDIESGFLKKISAEGCSSSDTISVTQIPFQMFSYKVSEQEKTCVASRDASQELISDTGSIYRESASFCNDEAVSMIEFHTVPAIDTRSVFSEATAKRVSKKSIEFKSRKGLDSASGCNNEAVSVMEFHTLPAIDTRSVFSESPAKRVSKKSIEFKGRKGLESASVFNNEAVPATELHMLPAISMRSVFPESPAKRVSKKTQEFKGRKGSVTPKAQRPSQSPLKPCGRSVKTNREIQVKPIASPVKQGRSKTTGHVSD